MIGKVERIRILDPACGAGELLLAIADQLPVALLSKSTLLGVDMDRQALEESGRRLDSVAAGQLVLEEHDFLAFCQSHRTPFGHQFGQVHAQPVDVIIANPPYVRTQVLGWNKSQELADAFGLRGRQTFTDAFLIGMTERLVIGGILGVITSNRFLSTSGDAVIREYSRSHFDILGISPIVCRQVPLYFLNGLQTLGQWSQTKSAAGWRRFNTMPRFLSETFSRSASG